MTGVVKIALLSSFTIRGLGGLLEAKCRDIDLKARVFEAGYNQINQEILSRKSGLNEFRPDVTFLLIDSEYVFKNESVDFIQGAGKRKRFIESVSKEFIGVVRGFLGNCSGIIVVSGLRKPTYSPLGINESKIELSAKEMTEQFNRTIKMEFLGNERVFVYDFDSFFSRFGERNIVNEKLRFLGHVLVEPGFLEELAEDFMGYVKALCSKNRKCIVLDLDNTLWGGIVGEDGFNKIRLDDKPPGNAFLEFQRTLLALHKRGIILAINSKNNPEDALKVIREHPYMILREKHFACMKINWEDKVKNLKEIANEINIGTDSMVFFDDSKVNREFVRSIMPEVLVVELPEDAAQYAAKLREMNDFNTLQVTGEDFKRGQMYYQQNRREKLRGKFSDLDSFLKNLKIKVEIKKADAFTIPRISQLTQKTNQFNLTTKRYSEAEIKNFSENRNYFVYSVNVRDKFGDNGLTGVIILEKRGEIFIIDSFLLSCRVIGRNVEKSVLKFAVELAKKEGMTEIYGVYVPSQKNMLCKNLYTENGFEKAGKNLFRLRNFERVKSVDYIEVETI